MCLYIVLFVNKFHYWLSGPSNKFRYKALALKQSLVIFHDSTQRHTNPSVVYVHNLLKYTWNILQIYRKLVRIFWAFSQAK